MALDILETPSRIGGMSILDRKHRRDERMRTADAGIEQRDETRRTHAWIGRTLHEICRPVGLFLNIESVEEINSSCGRSQRPNTAEPPDR